MTIICAYRDESAGTTWLGSNSRIKVGGTVFPGDCSKWSQFGDWKIALAGSGVMSALIDEARGFPDTTENIADVTAYLRNVYREANYGEEDAGRIDYRMNGMIVHKSGAIYDLDDFLPVAEVNANQFWANGSGMEYALGAAHTLRHQELSVAEMMHLALVAAIDLDTGCPGTPFVEAF